MRCCTEYSFAFNSDSSEAIAYNNPLFPVYIQYGILSVYPNYSAISHWHREVEFILVKKGKMTYNVNGKLIELSEGNGIMVNSRQLHYGFSLEHSECEFVCILFSMELLKGNEWFYQSYIVPIIENTWYPYLYLDKSNWTSMVLRKLEELYVYFEQYFDQSIFYFELIESVLSIMKLLYKNLDIVQHIVIKESEELMILRNMITYIEEHFMESITLEKVAASGACCKSRCSQLFKKYLYDTPITYITKLRLKKSLVTLLDSKKSITDIAYEYGFCGASYYCEVFKRYYGLSPFAYKKAQKGFNQKD